MKLAFSLAVAAAAVLAPCQVSARAVFAHFMVGNAGNYTQDDWTTDIKLAQDAHIDAFALNIAPNDNLGHILPMAFSAAASRGFKLFFSFDYAGHGAWPKGDVGALLVTYTALDPYYKYQGKYFVSTFEGPDNADDWIELKPKYNVFFMPDWSSLGAKEALKRGGGVADGLFSWAAWPWGPQDMDTYTDASYLQYLNGKPYMMPVAPWFFTNLPGYDKNWLWRGDSLWYDRWVQAAFNKTTPGLIDSTEFVEIISWNDYGESHYIGPLYDKAMEAFTIGNAPSNFATDMPHDGWRLFLPYVIDMFKKGTATITQEGLTTWYRLSPGAACSSTGTTGNTASQLQLEFRPEEIVQDKIFFSALLTSPASITVSVGGAQRAGSWTWQPDDNIGIYHGSVPFSGTGDVVVTLSRNGAQIAQVKGKAISAGCTSSLYNAWVGYDTVKGSVSAHPSLSVSQQACTNGTGAYNFAGLCGYACKYGYCPATACTCRQMGKPLPEPKVTNIKGYPIAGEDASYSGLCSWNCNHGYCPSSACGTVQVPLVVPNVSDFSPPACRRGTGTGALQGLCSFGCNYGFCPSHGCTCTEQGALIDAPPKADVKGKPVAGLEDYGLCDFACSHGYPPAVCSCSGKASSGDVYYPPTLWDGSKPPQVQCIPPCTIILPPYPLGHTTTITFPPMVTSVWTVSGGSTRTKTTVVTVPPLVTDHVPFWPVTVVSGYTSSRTVIYPLQSFMPPPTVITLGGNEATFAPVPSGSATPSPTFPGTPRPVTVQPQATSSVPLTQSIPTVTWSSATATATCTSGCGTDSCKLFGGCSSSDPVDDCGQYGCGGGCSIQGCDQTCGIHCSSDQHPPASDGSSGGGGSGSGGRPSLPVDYDGPDGTNDGPWNPPPIDSSFASSATSAMASEVSAVHDAVYSMLSNWNNEALKTAVRATATSVVNALSTHSSDVQAQLNLVASKNNGDFKNALFYFSSLFKMAIEEIQLAVDYAVNLPDPSLGAGNDAEARLGMDNAESAVNKLEEQISEFSGTDLCESYFECPSCNIAPKLRRAAPPSCDPSFDADPGEPSNTAEIKDASCASRTGLNTWTSQEILDALKQGVKYYLSDPIGAQKDGAPPWQYATKGMYPHVYSNSDGLTFSSTCHDAGSGFTDFLEFPIIPGGVLSAGRNSRANVGTDRVVFKVRDVHPLDNNWSWIYCGIMTHFTGNRVQAVVNGVRQEVLPFELCGGPF